MATSHMLIRLPNLPQVLACLQAEFLVTGPSGERRLGASEFFEGLMSTALGEDEVLTAVELPEASAGEGSAYAKFAHPASRYAVIGAAAKVAARNGVCTAASIVLGGLCPAPVRAEGVERALVGQSLSEAAIASASQAAAGSLNDDDVLGDVYASGRVSQGSCPPYGFDAR